MSISPMSNTSAASPKFGYGGYQPYPGLYGQPPFAQPSPYASAYPQQQPKQGASFLTKLLVGGIVIGGGAFALKRFAPETFGKIFTTIETVLPDFIKNGYSSLKSKAKNLLGIQPNAAQASGITGRAKAGIAAVGSALAWPFKKIFGSSTAAT